MTEDEMVGWHHSLEDMGLGGLRELVMDREAWCAVVLSRTTEQLNGTELKKFFFGPHCTACRILVP